MQLLAYKKYLPEFGVDVALLDPWNPRFLDHDIVHFFSCIGGSVHFCSYVKQLGMPLFVSSSLWLTYKNSHEYPIDEIRLQLSVADRVITNSKAESKSVAGVLGLDVERFLAVPNGIDPLFLTHAAGENTRGSHGFPYILNVANVEPRKNQLLLAEAIKALPRHKLVLAGNVRDSNYFDEVMRNGGEQVVYAGAVQPNSEALIQLYRNCDVFALPSTLETPGLAALEAYALGKPLVLTSEGCTKEYFGDEALYVDPSNAEQLAVALRAQLSLQKPKSRKQVVLSWQEVASKLAEAYQSYAK